MKNRSFGILKWPLLTASLAVLSGCFGEDNQDLTSYIAEVKSRPASGIEPLPPIPAYEAYAYDSTGLRNPFLPMAKPSEELEVVEGSGPGPDLSRQKEELEGYPLDTLRMVGTLNLNGKLWGLVRTQDKVIHRVLPGNYMGQNYGKILSITENKIELSEFITTGSGKWRERDASIALAE